MSRKYRPFPIVTRTAIGLIGLAGLPAAGAFAAAMAPAPSIADLSIEELMNVEVVSVSKKSQKLSDTAAAVFVISGDDIRRSGARNLPEALRLAPGVDVATIGGGAYAVSIRGFNGRFANDLLVLLDGRSVYNNLFSGVIWEQQLPFLDDIDRIEVTRGPGGAIWGANAVNGVIDIITRSSRDTLGGLATASAGQRSFSSEGVRYGTRLDEGTTFRVYGRASGEGVSAPYHGSVPDDAHHDASGGFRLDRDLAAGSAMLQGEVHQAGANYGIGFPTPVAPYSTTLGGARDVSGASLLGRWERRLESGGETSLQAYFDHTNIDYQGLVNEGRDVLDIEFKHRFHPHAAHDVVWGLGYRNDADDTVGSQFLQFTPAAYTKRIENLFVQDDIRLVPEKLQLTLGSKLEHDSITGAHLLPDARLLWKATPTAAVWAGASQAVRTPARAEGDAFFSLGPTIPAVPPFQPLPTIPAVAPAHALGAEKENSLQLGLRLQPARELSVDLTAFASHYRELRGGDAAGTPSLALYQGLVPYISYEFPTVNGVSATSRGAELALDWRATSWWRLQSSVSHMTITTDPAQDGDGFEGIVPRNILSLRSSMDLGATRFDAWLQHTDSRLVKRSNYSTVPGYTTLDLRLAWNISKSTEIALVGANLLQPSHFEFIPDFTATTEVQVPRLVYGSVRIGF